jgi:hypothetical protein
MLTRSNPAIGQVMEFMQQRGLTLVDLTTSDKLRQCARCTACGHKGATIQHPGWAGEHISASCHSRAHVSWCPREGGVGAPRHRLVVSIDYRPTVFRCASA